MLNKDISCFENNVDPDQLASEKSTDQISFRMITVFHSSYMLILSKHVFKGEEIMYRADPGSEFVVANTFSQMEKVGTK